MVTMPTAQTRTIFRAAGMSAESAGKYGGCHSSITMVYALTAKTAPVINSDWLGAMLFLFFIVCAYSLVAN
jgi:hypothetical protein